MAHLYRVLRSPRNTSPSASARVFPCSNVIRRASSFWKGKYTESHSWAAERPPAWCSPGWCSYQIILDELLVAQKDLLSAEDGGFWPIRKSLFTWFYRGFHFLLSGLGDPSDHLIGGLKWTEHKTLLWGGSGICTMQRLVEVVCHWQNKETSLISTAITNFTEENPVLPNKHLHPLWYMYHSHNTDHIAVFQKKRK